MPEGAEAEAFVAGSTRRLRDQFRSIDRNVVGCFLPVAGPAFAGSRRRCGLTTDSPRRSAPERASASRRSRRHRVTVPTGARRVRRRCRGSGVASGVGMAVGVALASASASAPGGLASGVGTGVGVARARGRAFAAGTTAAAALARRRRRRAWSRRAPFRAGRSSRCASTDGDPTMPARRSARVPAPASSGARSGFECIGYRSPIGDEVVSAVIDVILSPHIDSCDVDPPDRYRRGARRAP